MKKITIIAPFAFGYSSYIKDTLDKHLSVEATIIYLDQPAFAYKNGLHKIQNFFSKLLFNKNLKKVYVSKRIKEHVLKLPKQDDIFIIRPDILDNKALTFLKHNTKRFIAYYWDSTRRFPRMEVIVPFFDSVYSYDKLDVKKFEFQFLTNYIFEESNEQEDAYTFFNISTNDYRFPVLERIGSYLKNRKLSYKILIYNGSEMEATNVKIITKQLINTEVVALIKKCKIIIEIQRTEQVGLSFRIFEALGHRKKLITTNKDIINYDFYHPQNFLVIDEDDINIPEAFVTSPYIDIDEVILEKYKIENWVKPIFNL